MRNTDKNFYEISIEYLKHLPKLPAIPFYGFHLNACSKIANIPINALSNSFLDAFVDLHLKFRR
jgi:hypothetical protein